MVFYVVGTNSLSKAKLWHFTYPRKLSEKLETNLDDGFNKQTSITTGCCWLQVLLLCGETSKENSMDFGLFTPETWGFKVNPIFTRKTRWKKGSRFSDSMLQQARDMWHVCWMYHQHNWEPWTTQISASTKFFISIMFNLLLWPHSPTVLLPCAMATLVASDTPSDILDKEVEIHATEKFDTVSSLDAKSDTKKTEKNSDLVIYTPEKWKWNIIVTEIWFRWCSFSKLVNISGFLFAVNKLQECFSRCFFGGRFRHPPVVTS